MTLEGMCNIVGVLAGTAITVYVVAKFLTPFVIFFGFLSSFN